MMILFFYYFIFENVQKVKNKTFTLKAKVLFCFLLIANILCWVDWRVVDTYFKVNVVTC